MDCVSLYVKWMNMTGNNEKNFKRTPLQRNVSNSHNGFFMLSFYFKHEIDGSTYLHSRY